MSEASNDVKGGCVVALFFCFLMGIGGTLATIGVFMQWGTNIGLIFGGISLAIGSFLSMWILKGFQEVTNNFPKNSEK
jgi:hypothetical protein